MTQKDPEKTSKLEMTGISGALETLTPETFVGYDAFLRDIKGQVQAAHQRSRGTYGSPRVHQGINKESSLSSKEGKGNNQPFDEKEKRKQSRKVPGNSFYLVWQNCRKTVS